MAAAGNGESGSEADCAVSDDDPGAGSEARIADCMRDAARCDAKESTGVN